MHSPKYNLRLLETSLEELEAFLLSPEILWPLDIRSLPGESPFPRLSLGALLLTLDELDALHPELSPEQKARLLRAMRRWETLRQKWRSAMDRKAQQEMRMRFNLWKGYLADLEEDRSAVEAYPREVRQRVLFERLVESLIGEQAPEELVRPMRGLDGQLLERSLPAGFLWDPRLRGSYPSDRYWFLYRKPKPDW